MLINSRDAERESLFIEIWVTHSCSKAKIDSLKHIVEIRIKSEQDIQNIIQASCFIENNEDDSILFNKDKPLVIFHNFKRIIHEKKCPF